MSDLLKNIKFDCKYYTGYKPCEYMKDCFDCENYSPHGKRILIIKLAAIGDVLRTTPILHALKKEFNPCHITWITDPNAVPLLIDNHLIDYLLSYNNDSLLILLSEHYDMVLNFEKERRALALAKMIQADEKLGFAQTDKGKLTIYNKESEYSLMLGLSDNLKFRQNQKTYMEIIFEMAKLKYNNEEYILPLSIQAEVFATSFKQIHKLDKYKHIIGIHTGCGTAFPTKAWNISGFTSVIDELSKYPSIKCILLGGPNEKELNQKIIDKVGDKVINSGCDNSIEEFIGIVNCCELVLSLDSLAMHIAIGLKKKTVVLFGSTCHQEINLYDRGEKIISDFPCCPCYKKSCDKKPNCMDTISADMVTESIKRVLEI